MENDAPDDEMELAEELAEVGEVFGEDDHDEIAEWFAEGFSGEQPDDE